MGVVTQQLLSASATGGVDGAAAGAVPERGDSNSRWGGASQSVGGR